MSAPNIVNLAVMTGNTAVMNVTNTLVSIVSNDASSNLLYRINTLLVSNIDNTFNQSINARFVRNSVGYSIANTRVVSTNTTITLIDRNSGFYLQEGDSIQLSCANSNVLHALCSYEVISE